MTTILVVDDSATDRRLAGALLEKRSNWQIFYATDGKQALGELSLHLPDVVVTDLTMPEMNGLELVQAVKREYPLIPVILMTAKGSEEIAVQALKQGAASYVPKRLLAQDLLETVERVLAVSREERTHARVANRLTNQELRFVLENDLALILSLVGYLRQAVRSMRFCDDAEQLRLCIALEEALVNAYYHGNLEVSSQLREQDHKAYYELARQRSTEEPYRSRRIEVAVKLTRDEAQFTVRDEGPGFDPRILPDPTDPANLDRPCGRGILLMRTFTDDVRYNDSGNEVVMFKRRPGNSPPPPQEDADGN